MSQSRDISTMSPRRMSWQRMSTVTPPRITVTGEKLTILSAR